MMSVDVIGEISGALISRGACRLRRSCGRSASHGPRCARSFGATRPRSSMSAACSRRRSSVRGWKFWPRSLRRRPSFRGENAGRRSACSKSCEAAVTMARMTSVHRFTKSWRDEQARTPAHAFVPLSFAPGEAYQFDWSHETITLQGLPLVIKAAHMKLSHSRMPFVRAYFRETQELVFDAHDKTF